MEEERVPVSAPIPGRIPDVSDGNVLPERQVVRRSAAAERSPKDRQVRKSAFYLGSDELYRETLYYIRGYPGCRMAIESAEKSGRGYGEVRLREDGFSDPTFEAAARQIELTEARERVRIVEEALLAVPERYREGVYQHVVCRRALRDPMFDGVSGKTWKRWTQRFVYEVSRRRGLEEFMEALKSC